MIVRSSGLYPRLVPLKCLITSDLSEQVHFIPKTWLKVSCLLKILSVLNHLVAAIIWFAVHSDAQYPILTFVDFDI